MAYNVRHSKRVDHEPATGVERQVNLVREVAAWTIGLAVMLFVFWLARRYLF
jgi:hypothetical protein